MCITWLVDLLWVKAGNQSNARQHITVSVSAPSTRVWDREAGEQSYFSGLIWSPPAYSCHLTFFHTKPIWSWLWWLTSAALTHWRTDTRGPLHVHPLKRLKRAAIHQFKYGVPRSKGVVPAAAVRDYSCRNAAWYKYQSTDLYCFIRAYFARGTIKFQPYCTWHTVKTLYQIGSGQKKNLTKKLMVSALTVQSCIRNKILCSQFGMIMMNWKQWIENPSCTVQQARPLYSRNATSCVTRRTKRQIIAPERIQQYRKHDKNQIASVRTYCSMMITEPRAQQRPL